MKPIRTASLVGIPVQIRFEHLLQDSTTSPRFLTEDERVHDSKPHLEKVIFDVDVDWVGTDTIHFGDRVEAVFNYSGVYHFLTTFFHGRESLKAPLESVLDVLVSKAASDERVVAVRASATRASILLHGAVKVAVNWHRTHVAISPLPELSEANPKPAGSDNALSTHVAASMQVPILELELATTI